jgi:anti-sigma-K factor RskA
MNPRSRNEKQLMFDHCLGLTRAEQAVAVKALLAHNEQAAHIYARIQAALAPLESLHPEPCPAELAEGTIRRLCAAAQGARAAARMKTIDSSLHGLEDRRQCSSGFNAYDANEAAVMEFSPESGN